jgi:hypothetical protein
MTTPPSGRGHITLRETSSRETTRHACRLALGITLQVSSREKHVCLVQHRRVQVDSVSNRVQTNLERALAWMGAGFSKQPAGSFMARATDA